MVASWEVISRREKMTVANVEKHLSQYDYHCLGRSSHPRLRLAPSLPRDRRSVAKLHHAIHIAQAASALALVRRDLRQARERSQPVPYLQGGCFSCEKRSVLARKHKVAPFTSQMPVLGR